MRALVVEGTGSPLEVLHLDGARPDPVPDPGQVSVDVEACALDFADILLCRGTYQGTPPPPFTPGLSAVGTIARVGEGVEIDPGERVLVSTLLPHGGLAETCLAASTDVLSVPRFLGAVETAAMHVTYQTAWFALMRRARLESGETLVVHAGAGGVGSAAIQLGKALGARVIATAGGVDKLSVCRTLGADVVIDETSDVREAILAETGGLGADVILDPVGGSTFTESTRSIAFEGRLVVIGAASGTYGVIRSNHAMVKNYNVIGLNWGAYRSHSPESIHEAHAELCRLRADGSITPLVSSTIGLEQVPQALTDLGSRRTVGKVVVLP